MVKAVNISEKYFDETISKKNSIYKNIEQISKIRMHIKSYGEFLIKQRIKSMWNRDIDFLQIFIPSTESVLFGTYPKI